MARTAPARTLADVLTADGALGLPALDMLRPVAAELDALHDDGLVHRGVRPEAVLVPPDGRTATLAPPDAPAADVSESAERPGPADTTDAVVEPVYVAPEQAARGVTSYRSDVYSFAAVAFATLTGEPPFTSATVAEQAAGAVPSARARNTDLPADVDRVFSRALALAPEERPSSASEIVTALTDASGRTYRPPAGPALRRLVAATALAALLAVLATVVALVVTAGAADAGQPAPTSSATTR